MNGVYKLTCIYKGILSTLIETIWYYVVQQYQVQNVVQDT